MEIELEMGGVRGETLTAEQSRRDLCQSEWEVK